MMLKFIIGKAASGKTYEAIKIISDLSANRKDSVLLVPEQFTFENERMLLKALGDSASLHTSVLSFTRLCDELGRAAGGIAGKLLSDSDKIIFMSRALKNIGNELRLWNKFTSSVTFAKTMLDTIGEFKINAVSVEDLLQAAEKTDSYKLNAKLNDLAIIYQEYNTLVGESFIDPADRLTKLYRDLEGCKFFRNKTVIIDSFKGFTGQQYLILERIISQAEDVYICLTDNTENTREFSLFTNIRAAAQRIKSIAKKYGVTIEEPLVLKESRYNSEGLKALESFISLGKVDKISDSSVTLVSCENSFDETEYIARTIRKMVREEGYRFKDFVIIARDADPFTESVASVCQKNGVSVFYDKKVPLSSFAGAVAVNSAINALNFSTENLLRFHKTGLGTLEYEEICVLQNYAIIWNIEGDLWLKEWDMNPAGFSADNYRKADDEVTLEYLNELRIKAITPIINFKKRFKFEAKSRVKAIVELMHECDFSDKLTKLCDNFNNSGVTFTADVLKSSYDEYINILDSLALCFGDADITTSQFSESLELAVSLSSVGVIPQMLDQVTFGSADRIRPSRPKIAFILGANQGIFPKTVTNDGIFNINERRQLIEGGLPIADNSVYSAIDEEFLVYSNLCCPSDKLFILYSNSSVLGDSMEPSAFIENIRDNLSLTAIKEPERKLNINNIPETVDSAFSEFCRRYSDADNNATLKKALEFTSAEQKIELIDSKMQDTSHSVSPEISKQLFGKNIRMSASKFDTFSHCHFSYFCRYGLGVEQLQSAEFNVMQRGTIIHYVLQCFVEEFKDRFEELKTADLDTLTDIHINNYLDSIPGYRTIESPRLKFMISRLSRSLKEVVKHIAEEILQSDFKPVECEFRIGKGGALPTLQFPYSEGNIELTGSIDRVDKYGGYIRIIDYKSGNRIFVLSDILVGLNLQMLIYLYAITRGAGLDDSAAVGILYQPSKRNLDNKGIAMNGLIKEDMDLAIAMDKSGEGKFAPKLSYTKNGKLKSGSGAYIAPEDFSVIFNHIERLMKNAGDTIASGDFSVAPMDGKFSSACKYCDFSAVCGIGGKAAKKAPILKNEEVINIIREADTNGI